jgi:hypothetical protein
MGPSTGFYVVSPSQLLLVVMIQKPLGSSYTYLEPGDLKEPALGLLVEDFLESKLREPQGLVLGSVVGSTLGLAGSVVGSTLGLVFGDRLGLLVEVALGGALGELLGLHLKKFGA